MNILSTMFFSCLVFPVVSAGTMEDVAVQLAAKIAEKPFEAVKMIKRGVRDRIQREGIDRFDANVANSYAVFITLDCFEGVVAFL